MTLADAINSVCITEVWSALGGGNVRHGRGQAFWRNGDGFNVALDDRKNAWCDHAHGNAGGVLDLIQITLGCDRVAAVSWLAETFALEINNSRALTPTEKRAYARARREAEQFIAWRIAVLADMRERRNFHLSMYHAALRLILTHSLNHPMANVWADAYELHEARYLSLDDEIDSFGDAPEQQLLPVFYQCNRRTA